jgi:hypothetical protein
MTAFGMPGAGMGAPAAMAPQVGFVLDIPPDPSWEPFESADVLDQDGYYQLKITKESGRNQADKSQGIFLTMEVQDADARGKILSRFLPDPRTAKGNVWWIWRGLLRSITGTLDGARQGLRYSPGMFTNQLVYVKTERGMRDDRLSTDIDAWVTGPEWQEATRTNRHRWAPKAIQQGGNVGALPGGVPGGFPGLPGAGAPAMSLQIGQGLPGAPSAALPIAATTPQPGGAPFAGSPPAQQVFAPPPVQQAFVPPPVQQVQQPGFPGGALAPPAQAFAPPPVQQQVADPTAPAAPGQPFSFAAFPGMGAPPPVAGVNGAPPPQTAAGIVSSFPGMPPR